MAREAPMRREQIAVLATLALLTGPCVGPDAGPDAGDGLGSPVDSPPAWPTGAVAR